MTPNPQDSAVALEVELLPCPFCGGGAHFYTVQEGDDAGGRCVVCPQCNASSMLCFPLMDSVDQKLIEHWNRRASQSDGTSGGAKTLILLSSGEYSDYGLMGAFRPMKAFNVGDALEAFKAQWKPEPGTYCSSPGPSDFAAWLAKEGYIEDAPTEEIHLGSYGDIDPSPETRKLTFAAPTQGENHVG